MNAAVAVVEDATAQAEFLAVSLPFFKATPHTEGDRRIIFCEASNEAWDQERERILKSALLGSTDLFLAKGNLDIEHLTILGHQLRIANPHLWEVGLPLEVREAPRSVLVKGELYQGDGPAAEKANYLWSSLTMSPAMRWFPSVGGKPLERKRVLDPATGQHRTIITKAAWRNLAFAKEPQNLSVPAVSTQGFDDFMKSVRLADSLDACDGACGPTCCGSLTKAITAAGGTDSAGLTGGAALRVQSHAGVADPWDGAATRFLRGLGTGTCEHTRQKLTRNSIQDHFAACEAMPPLEARRATARLLNHVRTRVR